MGKDAAPAMEALQRLFDTNFSEAYGQGRLIPGTRAGEPRRQTGERRRYG